MAFQQIQNTNDFWEFSKFVLEYPESEFFYTALQKYHSTRDAYFDSIDMPIIDCFRNCANIQIKGDQRILFEHKLVKLEALHDSLLNFYLNDEYDESKPEKKYIEDVYGKPQEISKGHIQVQYINDSCAVLQNVMKEISCSIFSYKKYLSQKWYHKKWEKLEIEERDHLNFLFYNRLIIFGWDEEYVVPPPPPPPTEYEK